MLDPSARKVDQHLSYLHCLLDSAEQCASRHAQYAHLQSALLQMGLAWGFYLVEIGARYGLKSPPSYQYSLSLPEGADWLQKPEGLELTALLRDSESWLATLRQHLQGIGQLEQRTGLAGDLFSYREPASELIAATAQPELPILSPALVKAWANQFQALVRRQRGYQEEY